MPKFRIYANRQNELPWSIDSGTQADEAHVQSITFHNVSGLTITDFAVRTGDENTPKWWVEVHRAVLEICGDVARFYGEDRER